MSNVAATVVLVPLVMIIGRQVGVDPRGLALLAAVSASNSFILPTHQVNAFFMSAGNYRSSDYLKAGAFLSLGYIIIVSMMIYLFYL
jgi:di/tricarboxylate transporter